MTKSQGKRGEAGGNAGTGRADYRQLFEQAADAILIHTDTAILAANRQACRLFDHDQAELLALRPGRLIASGQRMMLRSFRLRLAKHGQAVGELDLVRADGSPVPVEIASRRLAWRNLPATVSICRDVSARKHAEHALLAAAQEWQRTFDAVHSAIFLLDGEFRIMRSNRMAAEMFGMASGEMLGRYCWEVVHGSDRHHPECPILAMRRSKRRESSVIAAGDRWLSVTVDPLLDELGEITGVIHVVADITEAKHAEAMLRNGERRLSEIVASAPFGAYSYDLEPDGRLVLRGFNRAAEQIVGISHAALLGKTIEEAFPLLAETPIPDRYRAVAATGERYDESQVSYDGGGIKGVFEVHAFQTGPQRMCVFFQDVSTRAAAEEAIRASERQYRSLIETTDTGFVVVAPDGAVLDANQEYVRLSGHRQLAEIMGRSVVEWTAPADRERNAAAIAQCLRDGRIRNFEVEYVDGAGRGTPLELNGTTVGEGAYVRILTLCRDITDRRRAHDELTRHRHHLEELVAERAAALKESERRYRELVEYTNSIILRLDTVGNITFANEFAQSFFGFRADELIGRNAVGTIVPKSDSNGHNLEAMILELGRDPEKYRNNLNENIKKSGERVWIAWTNQAIRDEQGRVTELMCIGNDITERIHAERELEQYRNRLETMVAERTEELDQAHDELDRYFKLSLDLLCIANQDGYFQRLNPAWEQTLGFSGEELMRSRFIDFVHPDDVAATREVMGHLSGQQQVLNFVNRFRCRDGSYRWIEWRSRPVGNLIFAMARDITERRELEEHARHAEKMEAIGKLAGGIAHDFNNQLMGIMGYAELLHARLGEDELRDDAASILRASRRAAELTRNLLAFSRKGKYLTVTVDLHQVIGEIVAILERSIDRRIVIRQELRAEPATVRGDPAQIQNALLNLALNARDAMPEGGELSFATAVVPADGRLVPAQDELPATHCLQVVVRDTGVGMTPAVMRHIFEPFFTTKESPESIGMGLASVYGTVKIHHGAIGVVSEPGQGTEFTLCLPLCAGEVEIEVASPGAVPSAGSARIMVVDDEEVVRNLVAAMLRKAGHRVTTCVDGLEAVARYREEWRATDLVLLDMMMPRMSGRDAFHAMREINSAVKVVLASGFSVEGEAQDLLAAGALAFIAKPFDMAQLNAAINQALTGS